MKRVLLRNFVLAAIAGGIVASRWGGFGRWPLAAILALWFSLGGYLVEALFLNVIKPRLPADRARQTVSRVITWLLGGSLLGLGMALTGAFLTRMHRLSQWPAPWLLGLGFVGLELLVHAMLVARREPNFYDGRG